MMWAFMFLFWTYVLWIILIKCERTPSHPIAIAQTQRRAFVFSSIQMEKNCHEKYALLEHTSSQHTRVVSDIHCLFLTYYSVFRSWTNDIFHSDSQTHAHSQQLNNKSDELFSSANMHFLKQRCRWTMHNRRKDVLNCQSECPFACKQRRLPICTHRNTLINSKSLFWAPCSLQE